MAQSGASTSQLLPASPSSQRTLSDYLSVRRAEDIKHVLREKIALLPGARDRELRPIIFVPARENSTPTNSDHLRNLLLYLYEITCDKAKERGFIFVIDMRKGTTLNTVKPVLKCLEDFFPATIHIVYIIKPEKLWEKHKTSMATGKYKFDIQMISIENLTKYIDTNQILREFGGSLFFDHDDWLDLRVDIEKFTWEVAEMLRHFENCKNEIEDAEIPVDVSTAKGAINQHKCLHSKISSLSVDDIDIELNYQELDKCCELKLWEHDADNFYQWVRTQSSQISCNLPFIGHNEQEAQRLLKELNDFSSYIGVLIFVCNTISF